MGNKPNLNILPWIIQAIVLLWTGVTLISFVDGKAENGFTLIPSDIAPTTAVINGENVNESKDAKRVHPLHNAQTPFSSTIDGVFEERTGLKELITQEEASENSLIYNSVEPPPSSSSVETEEGMEINDNLERWMEQLGNSNKSSNNNSNNNSDVNYPVNAVITQAFRFVKLDSHLAFLVSQLANLQSIHTSLEKHMTRQDTKFTILLNQIHSLVNSIVGEKSRVNAVEDKIETEIQKMNQRLDQAVEKIIQSSTTSFAMFDLSKESLLQMDKMETTSNQILNEAKAVRKELGNVGQVSIQTIYNLNKLEENLMAGMEQAANRTVYALRQDAKIIGPTVLLEEEDGYEGNSIQYQADAGGSHSVKKLSLVGGGTIKAESLVQCLSKRLINEKRPRDCGEIQLTGHLRSGVYAIYPFINSDSPTEVYCDLETNGGPWTVFQRRTDSRENFFRTWREYKEGFGSSHKQHWLGLDTISQMTQFGDQELRIEITDWSGESRHANYAYFKVANATDKFRLHLADFSGSAGDSLNFQNGMQFSTKDQDNDLDQTVNCAEKHQGGWWFKNCHTNFSNLNGAYTGGKTRGRLQSYGMGINWYSWHGYYYSIQRTEMKMRSRFLSAFSTSK